MSYGQASNVFSSAANITNGSYAGAKVATAAAPSAARVLPSQTVPASYPTTYAARQTLPTSVGSPTYPSGVSSSTLVAPAMAMPAGPTPRYTSPAAAVSPTIPSGARVVKTMAPTVTKAATRIAASPVGASPVIATKTVTESGFKLKLGAEIPNFTCETTHGNFPFHDFVSGGPMWTVLFSHPADFTPVCTTELGRCEVYAQEFAARGVQLIGLSCDPVDSHKAWTTDILAREQIVKPDGKLSFPIIADPTRKIAGQLGMLDPEEIDGKGVPLPARALFVIDQTKKVKLSILYPATTGRDFGEVLRVIDSLTLTKERSLATPADWRPGDRCIVAPNVPTEEAQQKFEDLIIEDLPSKKQYLRHVKCPAQPQDMPGGVGVGSGVGVSTLENTRDAVLEAVQIALQTVQNPALVFAGCTCERNVEEVQAAFAEFLPGVPLHGITSSGFLLHPSGSFPNGIGCLMLAAPEGAFAAVIADTAAEAAELLAQQMPEPQAIIMSTVPGNEEDSIDILNQKFGVPVYGGTAADNELKGEWRVFGTAGVTSTGISLVGIAQGMRFGASMVGPYAPTDVRAVITKGEGRRAYEINNMPAADWVYQWLGAEVENEYVNGGLILPQTAQKPIGFPLQSGNFQSAHLAALGGPEKYVDFFTPIVEGMELVIMDSGAGPETGYAQTLADAYDVAMQSGQLSQPSAGLLIYCGGMAIAVGDNLNAGLSSGLGAIGNLPPILGLTCFGEQAFHPEDSMNLQRNLSMGFLLFE